MLNDGLSSNEYEIKSFLMIGQSNMAGRGTIGDVEPIINDKCFMLRMGRWQKMSEPVNVDRAVQGIEFPSGVCLATSFADELSKKSDSDIGLIPCADGGTSISEWQPGGLLYDHALFTTKLAMRTSKLSAILWHQGETDCVGYKSLDTYKAQFINMLTSLRKDLGNETLPALIGELSENLLDDRWRTGDNPKNLNEIFSEIEKEVPFVKVVSSKDLTLKPDGLHFDAKSLRVFGKRYFEKYLEF